MPTCHISFLQDNVLKSKSDLPIHKFPTHPEKHVSGGSPSPRKSKQTLCCLQMRISSQYWKYPSPNCKFGKLAPRLLAAFTSALWTLSQVSVNASSPTPISCCFPKSFLLPFCQLNMFAPKWKQLPESIHQQCLNDGGFLSPAVPRCDWGLFDAFPSLLGHHIAFWTFQQLLCFCSPPFQLFEVLWSIFLHRIPRVPQSKPDRLFLLAKNHYTFYLLFDALCVWICVCVAIYEYIHEHIWTAIIIDKF